MSMSQDMASDSVAHVHGMSADDVILSLRDITKSYGDFNAVDDLSLDIRRGEVFSLLGPSGCGKSTTLRQIAGLDQPTVGTIKLNDRVLFSSTEDIYVPTQKRNMGMVFQSYAIWPHLSIFETVAYPLRVRKMPSQRIDELVDGMLRQVQLPGMGERSSMTLSGGQQQRVALARALVYKPDVLLLDEPFSNLDVKLREQMRVELKLLQRELGVTVILVTHDQSEALSLSDRIAVMNAGSVEQVGTPFELYESPATPFVRDFIGQTTKLEVTVAGLNDDGLAEVSLGNDQGRLFARTRHFPQSRVGSRAMACIRPENILVGSAVKEELGNVTTAHVETALFLGDRFECLLQIAGQKIMAHVPRAEFVKERMDVRVQLTPKALSLWPVAE